jgi:hypothetical protein
MPDDLKRLPGLYRRWELNEVLEPHRNYQIEDAGTHADGTPLLALYATPIAPDVTRPCRRKTDLEQGE